MVENDAYVAVGDCTGHGVQGAFMTMIAYALLNEIVQKDRKVLLRNILTELNLLIMKALKQETSKNDDGMDLAICRFQFTPDGISSLIFAGAKLPLWHYSNGDLVKIEGAHKAIGGRQNKHVYTSQDVEIQSGDIFYLASDGYIDQNNKHRQRLGSSRFINLLQENAQTSMLEQRQMLIEYLQDFQQEEAQRDDITVLGIKLG